VIEINLVDHGRHTGPSPNPTHDWRQVACFWWVCRKDHQSLFVRKRRTHLEH
jgi:hypothetical protein